MIRQDYLLKLIEEAGYAIARLMGMRTEGRYEEVLRELDQLYESFGQTGSAMLRQTEEDDLLPLLIDEGGLGDEQLTVIAQLLAEEGATWRALGEWEKANSALRKALRILVHLDESQPELYDFDRKSRIGVIRDHLAEINDQ
ncbi:MAG: hypothetical protein AAFV07_01900 [Bacteroidota bacterium]